MGRLRRLRRCNPLARHNLFWAGTFPRYFRVIPRFGAIWCDMLTAFIGNAFLYTEIYEIMFAFCAYTLGIRFCFLGEKGGSTKNPFYIVNYVKCIFSAFWFWAYPPPLMAYWLVVCLPLILSGSPPRVASHDIDSCLSVFAFSPAHIRLRTIIALQPSGSDQSGGLRFGAFLYRS